MGANVGVFLLTVRCSWADCLVGWRTLVRDCICVLHCAVTYWVGWVGRWRSGVLGITGYVELSSCLCHRWVVLFLLCDLIVGQIGDGGVPREDTLVGCFGVALCCVYKMWRFGCVWDVYWVFRRLAWGWMHCRNTGGLFFGGNCQVTPGGWVQHLFLSTSFLCLVLGQIMDVVY